MLISNHVWLCVHSSPLSTEYESRMMRMSKRDDTHKHNTEEEKNQLSFVYIRTGSLVRSRARLPSHIRSAYEPTVRSY